MFDGRTLEMQVRGKTTEVYKGQGAGSVVRTPEDTSFCKHLRVLVWILQSVGQRIAMRAEFSTVSTQPPE